MNPARPHPREEQRAEIRRFLAEVSPPAEVRRLMATEEGYDAGAWLRMAETLGLQALLVPAVHGGLEDSWPAVALALEEMGRVLLCAPFLSTAVLATTAIVGAGDADAQRRWLPDLGAGRLVATVALAEPTGGWDPARVATTATRSARDRYVLEGSKAFVLDGHVADLIVVPAQAPSGLSLFAVDGDAEGLTRTASPTMDQTRKLATLGLSATPARRLGELGAGGPVLRRVLDLAAVALAAEAVGGAQRCLEMSVDHAMRRYQFGRPIGTFQAVKHRCADMLLAVESARAVVAHAARAATHEEEQLTTPASLAKVCCSEAYLRVAAGTIQVHGALGFSWDHDAHLYFKRATSGTLLFGDAVEHRRRLADQLDL